MIGIVNSGAGGSGGTLTVTAPAGVTVTASKDGKTYTRTANAQGVAVFKGLKTGVWSVTISDGVQNPTTMQVEITADYALTINFFMASISVTYPEGSTCKCAKGSNVLTAAGTSGSYTFTVPEAGDWAVSCTNGADTASKTVTITTDGQSETVNLAYQLYASDFNWASYGTLNTDYEIVYDNDTAIPETDWPTAENWKARLLTSNTLTPMKDGKIDVFCVGGGGGRIDMSDSSGGSWQYVGAGGYTKTALGIPVTASEENAIMIGAPGTNGSISVLPTNDGGTTSAFGCIAAGGQSAKKSIDGVDGGSGAPGYSEGARGIDGGDGGTGTGSNKGKGGKGQISQPGPNGETGNTREFGEENGTLYSYSGSQRDTYTEEDGPTIFVENSGNGAGGAIDWSIPDTSNKRYIRIDAAAGIVVIRNARGGAA